MLNTAAAIAMGVWITLLTLGQGRGERPHC